LTFKIEAGESVTLVSFVRVLRALGLLDALDRLVPEPTPSPIELLKLHGRRRQRASGTRGKSAPAQRDAAAGASTRHDAAARWRWGDEVSAGGS
jgi:hypothetical protein